MTSSSPERAVAPVSVTASATGIVLTADRAADVRPLALPQRELRTGGWTRLGPDSVLGDAVTEQTLAGLAAQTQVAARSQGYAIGWAEGRRAAEERARVQEQEATERYDAAEQRREAEHRAAVEELFRAAARVEQAFAATCAQVEDRALDLAVTLTEALVGHHVAAADTPGLDTVRTALALAGGDPVARVRLSVEEARDSRLADAVPGATVVPDPSLSRGDAVLETADGVVDARISAALQRVREVLR